jgi:hypothetical protein
VKRQLAVTALGALSLAATLATATPASAATHKSIGWTNTTDRAPGGKAWFNSKGNVLTVCDVEKDGWAVKATLFTYQPGQYGQDASIYWGTLQDGGSDGCGKGAKRKSFSKAENAPVQIEICLTSRDSGDSYCRTSAWGTA